MRKPLLVGLLTALLATLLSTGPALSAGKTVRVDDNYFVGPGTPPTVRVHRYDKVKWEWEGSGPHNVTVTRGPVRFHSPTKSSGTYSKRLTRRGTYKIICTLHRPTMRMTLRVR
jgi:plastocyanin